jgi:hypothetical protein
MDLPEIEREVAGMSTTAVAGHGPLSFTDSNGRQRSVPLSALQFNGSKLELKSQSPDDWTGPSGIANTADQTTLLAVAAERLSAGELFAPPMAPPSPAILFTAAVAGPEGNDITVNVSQAAGNALTAQVTISAKTTDVYAGLPDGATAKTRIGVDDPGTSGDRAGSGIVMVKESAPIVAGLPKDGQNLTVTADTNVLADDGVTTLFTLVPRPGAPVAGIPVTVAVDPGSNPATFTLTASFDTGPSSAIGLNELTALPAPVPFLISASPPPRGVAVPVGGDVQLSGGAPGVAASATAYTS